MKKLVFVFVALLLVNLVSSADIAYVLKNPANPEQNIINSINELGYSYDLIDDSLLSSTNFSSYRMIVLGDERISNVPVNSYKSIIINPDYYPSWSKSKGSIAPNTALRLYISDANHKITQGVTQNFQAYTASGPLIMAYYLASQKYSTSSLITSGDSQVQLGNYVVAIKDNPRRVFFGITKTEYWTEDSKLLFKNSIRWILDGEDRDGDGYYTDSDCNDNDASLYQNLQGYLDNDNDRYGYGNLINICSGEDLPNGYLPEGASTGDCNDNDASLYQNLQGYLDDDLDGFGYGNLINVCSGELLPVRYVTNDNDCNDSDSDLYRLISGYKDNDNDSYGSLSIEEVCSGEDLKEGYVTTSGDCNDNNPLLYQILDGYRDKDLDSYGNGSLVSVCSGEILPIGYNVQEGDCDDNNQRVSPGSIEIPYNKIDEDCDGVDLIDVDSDSFNGILANGTDCNDNDETVYPGSEDLSKNCINDKPVIEEIDNLIFDEGDKIIIDIEAIDPENDNLTFTINDSRFIKMNNAFLWQSNYDDFGSYSFNVTVSDKEYKDSQIVEIQILNKNRPPVCEVIPNLEWDEDNQIILNLNDYCIDPDNETLEYDIHSTSEGSNIVLFDFENGTAIFRTTNNGYGNDWITFDVSDSEDVIQTNSIRLRADAINDAPILSENISNINSAEDVNLTDYLDLNDYFYDIDNDILEFSATSSSNIQIIINDGKLSIFPKKNFYGEERIRLTARDSEYSVESNEFVLNLTDANEPPELVSYSCNQEIIEDTSYECNLSANDFENNTISYSIVSENNLDCSFNLNQLTYSSYKDYNGSASCKIRLSDEYGSNDYDFIVNIQNVNDAPLIIEHHPDKDIKVLKNTNKIFGLNAKDVDSNYIVKWFVNQAFNAEGNNLTFNNDIGNYNVSAIVSDGEFNSSYDWNVKVGDLNEFTCNEVDGDICTTDEICKGELLGVYDSKSCCSISCTTKPPQFKSIKKRCENTTNLIAVSLKKNSVDDEYLIGQAFQRRFLIGNNLDRSLDLDVEAYLYDNTKNKVLDKLENSIIIAKEQEKYLNFEMIMPEDVDEDKEYYIFVKLQDQDSDYCTEAYYNVEPVREDHKLAITKTKINEENIICGDDISIEVGVENQGQEDEEATISVNSDNLNINEEKSFVIEGYGDDDYTDERFDLSIPKDTKPGIYKIDVNLDYSDKTVSIEQEVNVVDCKIVNVETTKIETIKINRVDNSEITKTSLPIDKVIALSSVSFMLVILLITTIVFTKRHNSRIQKLEINKVRSIRKAAAAAAAKRK